MSRSSKKGPYVDPKLLKKISRLKTGDVTVINTWSRSSEIAPEMVGFTVGVHNGKTFTSVYIKEEMVVQTESIGLIKEDLVGFKDKAEMIEFSSREQKKASETEFLFFL